MNEEPLVYKYPEHEAENTKRLRKLEELEEQEEPTETTAEVIMDDEVDKKNKKLIIILSSVFGGLVLLMLLIFFIIPALTKPKMVVIPSVKGLTISKAEAKLEEKGLVVSSTIKKKESKKIKKGRVIKTNPAKGKKVKVGTKVTLYKSIGKQTYKLDDYTGKNYKEVQSMLEKKYGLKVTIEKKDITDTEKDEEEIIGQSLAKDSEVKKGDEITLYIPNIIETFPDMVKEGYSVDDAEAFCKKYNLTLKKNLVETNSAAPGKVIAQSRIAGSEIVEGTNLTVDVAAKPVEQKKDTTTEKEKKEETQNESTPVNGQ